MKKQLNVATITSELRGHSAFFPHEEVNPNKQPSASSPRQQGQNTPQVDMPGSSDKSGKRKQISAHLSLAQHQQLKQLYFLLNRGDVLVEKSEIVGLGIEIVAKMLNTQVPAYASMRDIAHYLDTQIEAYLDTQVPGHKQTT